MFYKQYFLFILLFYWHSFTIVRTSLFFVFDKQLFKRTYNVNENFTIGAHFVLPSSFECNSIPCLVNLKLTFIDDEQILENLWCYYSSAIFKLERHETFENVSCVWNNIDPKRGDYRISAIVQASTEGSFTPVLSAEFLGDSKWDETWISQKIVVLNASNQQYQAVS